MDIFVYLKDQNGWRKNLKWFAGLSTAAFVGWISGAGIEQAVADEVMRSIAHGDLWGFLKYVGIAFVLWIEVRGLKKEIKNVNTTVKSGFHNGELRFEIIEKDNRALAQRLTVLETLTALVNSTPKKGV